VQPATAKPAAAGQLPAGKPPRRSSKMKSSKNFPLFFLWPAALENLKIATKLKPKELLPPSV
jgi:hypothetical protein